MNAGAASGVGDEIGDAGGAVPMNAGAGSNCVIFRPCATGAGAGATGAGACAGVGLEQSGPADDDAAAACCELVANKFWLQAVSKNL